MFVIVSLKDQNQGDYSFFAMITSLINKQLFEIHDGVLCIIGDRMPKEKKLNYNYDVHS